MAETVTGPRRNGRLVVVALVVLVVAAAGWYLLSPLFLDEVVDEPFPLSAGAVVPDGMTQEEVEAEMAAAAGGDGVEAAEPMTDAMVAGTVLATGAFAGADAAHDGTGTATVYELEDGSRILRLEDFEVTNGPRLHVFLTPAGGVMDGAVDLGELRGNIGNQNYAIPEGTDLAALTEVVIYCVPFSVTFASAALS